MIKEFMHSVKSHLEDRISNPILGAFGVSWLVFNWKPVLIMVFGEKTIEEKISVVSDNYQSWEFLIWYPLSFTAFYLLILPWLLLGIQMLQEKAITQRRTRQLTSDTAYLSAKVEFVRAESALDSIRLEHELRKEVDIKNRDMELEREKARHNFELERERRHMEFEFEERKSKYENDRRHRELAMEHEKSIKQLELEEKRRFRELRLEKQRELNAEKGV